MDSFNKVQSYGHHFFQYSILADIKSADQAETVQAHLTGSEVASNNELGHPSRNQRLEGGLQAIGFHAVHP